MKKKFAATFLTATMALSIAAVPLVGANTNIGDISQPTVANTATIQPSDDIVNVINEAEGPTSRITYVAVDEDLTAKNGSQTVLFDTSKKYGWYKIWISNPGNVKYKVIIKDAKGKIQGETEVSAKDTITIRNSNAATGRRTVSITSTDGSKLSGRVSVRLGEAKSEVAN